MAYRSFGLGALRLHSSRYAYALRNPPPPAGAAPANTSLPVISGTPTVGETLTASIGTWSNTPTGYARQWYADAAPISGATTGTHELTDAEEGAEITFGVVATNDVGDSVEAMSAGLGPIAAAEVPVPIFTVNPSISPGSGTAGGTTFTATDGTHDGTSSTRRWLLDGAPIGTGATILPDTAGSLVLEVTASNEGGDTIATSTAVTVGAAAVAVPVNSVAPAITGIAQVYEVQTATPGTWSNSPTSYAYQWQRNNGSWVNISGATASTYLPTPLDEGLTLRVQVLASNPGGPAAAAANSSATGTIAAAASPNAPILTLAVGVTTYPPQFDATLDDTHAVGDTITLEWSTDIRFGSITGSATNAVNDAEAIARTVTFTGLSSITSPAIYYYRAKIGGSNWSATVLHGAVADGTPSAFSFTDATNVALSTIQTSNEITLTGFNQPIIGDAAGAEYAVDTGSGYGSWITTGNMTFYPGDKVKVRHTSSASNSTPTNTTFTAGGVSDTFTSTTQAAIVTFDPTTLWTAAQYGYAYDPNNTAKVWQDSARTIPGAASSPIGALDDFGSGSSRHMLQATSGNRPTLVDIGGGKLAVQYDGTDDYLNGAFVGAYGSGSGTWTFIAAVKSTAPTQVTRYAFGETGSGNANPVYWPVAIGPNASTSPRRVWIRNDSGGSITDTSNISSAWNDGSWDIVVIVDNGSSVVTEVYRAGALQSTSTVTYTHTGTMALLNQTIFGMLVRNSVSAGTAAGMLQGRTIGIRKALSSPEKAGAMAWCAEPYGVSLP